VLAGFWSDPKRWRTFADVVAMALGINVWVSVVVLPGFFVGGWHSSTEIAASLLPLVVLMIGLWRRNEVVLLLGFPSALLIPTALNPAIVSSHVYGPIRFVVVAVGLIAFLMGASFFTSWYEPPPPESVRPLASSRRPIPERWKRRFRVYRYLIALSIVFPVTFVYLINFDDTNQAFLLLRYPGRVNLMVTVLNLLVIGAWFLIYAYAFMGILRPHRTGDRNLVTDLARIRAESKRGRPRFVFYVGVVCALGFMLALMMSRYT
jgi:hypothetical protein